MLTPACAKVLSLEHVLDLGIEQFIKPIVKYIHVQASPGDNRTLAIKWTNRPTWQFRSQVSGFYHWVRSDMRMQTSLTISKFPGVHSAHLRRRESEGTWNY